MTDRTAPARSFTRWDTVRLFWRQLGLVSDLFLSVVGAGMFALATVVFLSGLGFISTGIELSTGALLGSSLVIAVVGLFAVGVASEGPLTGEAYAYPELELAISRAFGVIVVSLLGLTASSALASFASDVSYPFELAVAVVRSVALAGLILVLPLAVPASWYLRREIPIVRVGWDRLLILMIWFVTAWVVLGSTI